MIKAIIFDADGVILDSENLWDTGQVEFLARYGKVYDRAKTKHLLTGRSLSEGSKIMMQQYDFTGNPEALGEERYEIMIKFYDHIAYMPGFLDFYNKLKGSYKTAVATSSNLKLFGIANEKLKLSELFGSHIYFLKDVNNVSKPEPDIFLYAAKMLKTDPKECLVIEDAPNGVMAAKRAGMNCIALSTTHGRDHLAEANNIVDSFDEIDLSKF
jgi:beta-phosphoglucomutase